MSTPWVFNSLAFAAIARVAEVGNLLILSDSMKYNPYGFAYAG
jgi:hypothetical protein